MTYKGFARRLAQIFDSPRGLCSDFTWIIELAYDNAMYGVTGQTWNCATAQGLIEDSGICGIKQAIRACIDVGWAMCAEDGDVQSDFVQEKMNNYLDRSLYLVSAEE